MVRNYMEKDKKNELIQSIQQFNQKCPSCNQIFLGIGIESETEQTILFEFLDHLL
jgi:hypothetical protein